MDNARLKIWLGFIFGYTVAGSVIILGLAISLGQVKAETSYGLLIVLNTLGMLGAGFVAWAFGYSGKDKHE